MKTVYRIPPEYEPEVIKTPRWSQDYIDLDEMYNNAFESAGHPCQFNARFKSDSLEIVMTHSDVDELVIEKDLLLTKVLTDGKTTLIGRVVNVESAAYGYFITVIWSDGTASHSQIRVDQYDANCIYTQRVIRSSQTTNSTTANEVFEVYK